MVKVILVERSIEKYEECFDVLKYRKEKFVISFYRH